MNTKIQKGQNVRSSSTTKFNVVATPDKNVSKLETYAVLKPRLYKAYLSEKNVESVTEQMILELKKFQIDPFSMYEPRLLFDFLQSVMNFVFSKWDEKTLSSSLIKSPIDTIIQLNYIAMKNVTKQIKERYDGSKRGGITRFPNISDTPNAVHRSDGQDVRIVQDVKQKSMQPLPTYTQSSEDFVMDRVKHGLASKSTTAPIPTSSDSTRSEIPITQSTNSKLCTSLDEIFPKKRKRVPESVSLKFLDKHKDVGENEWWTEERHLPRESHKSRSTERDMQQDAQRELVEIDPILPFEFLTLERKWNKSETEFCVYKHDTRLGKTLSSIQLHRVRCDLQLKCLSQYNDKFYWSEDDDEMQVIIIPHEMYLSDIPDFLTSELTKGSRKGYKYDVHLTKAKGKKMEIIQTAPKDHAIGDFKRPRFHLFFEDTQSNCAKVLGFEEKNYRDAQEYCSQVAYGILPNEIISFCVPCISPDRPLFKLELQFSPPDNVYRVVKTLVEENFFRATGLNENLDDGITVKVRDEMGNLIREDQIATFNYQVVLNCFLQVEEQNFDNQTISNELPTTQDIFEKDDKEVSQVICSSPKRTEISSIESHLGIMVDMEHPPTRPVSTLKRLPALDI